ncbi:MAG: cell division protein SepF [Lachnospiraceae bacterium]|nr:cell division protein SepF [Lachnospiraceae bacterium]
MGLLDKLKGWTEGDDVNVNDYDDYEDDENYDANGDDYEEEQPVQQASAPKNVSLNASALEMKVLKPERYDSTTAQKIADHLLNRRTVVLNLESTNKESARRLIDFLSGVAYSIDGNIQRVTTNTVVIVPNNVDVTGDQLGEAGAAAADIAGADDMF